MSVTKYNLTLTFDPAAGATVEQGQVVTIGSNLTDWLNTINPAEVNNMAFSNTTNNWASQDGDNTAVIENEGNITVKARLDLGYIHVEGEATYDAISDLYILGTVMGRRYWAPSGPKFTYDAVNEEYYIDVYFRGGENTLPPYDEYQSFGYFSFATHISDYDWKQMTGYIPDYYWNSLSGRLGAATDDLLLGVNETGVPLYSYNNDNNCAFKIPAGIYHITVNKAKSQMNITEIPAHLYFTPVSGTTVGVGEQVSISSDLQTLVWDIAASYGLVEEYQQYFMIKTDDMTGWNDNGQFNDNDILITRQGDTTYVYGHVELSYIVVQDTAKYYIPVYNISTVVAPEGGGVIAAPENSAADQTVTFTVTANDGYATNNVVVRLGNDETVPVTDNNDGTYSFVMPDVAVTIYVDFEKVAYHLTTAVQPSGAGQITFTNLGYNEWVPDGQEVQFSVSSNNGYRLIGVTMSYVDENDELQTITLTQNEGTYSFTMPAADVTITAEFETLYSIEATCNPVYGGSISISGGSNFAAEGETVTFSVNVNPGYRLISLTMFYVDENDQTQTTTYDISDPDSFSFIMPAANVRIHAVLDRFYTITKQSSPSQGGTINLSETEACSGQQVSFTVDTNTGYRVTIVTASHVTQYGNTQTIAIACDENGVYTFNMPAADVTLTANFVEVPLDITTVCYPDGCGVITLKGDAADGNEFSGQTVLLNVKPSAGYGTSSVIVTIDGTDQTVDVTQLGDGNYSFVMPSGNVTVTANFVEAPFAITIICSPDTYGEVLLRGEAADGNEFSGQTVLMHVNTFAGYEIDTLYVLLARTGAPVPVTKLGNGDYSFVMPFGDVKVYALFTSHGYIYTVCEPAAGGEFIDLSADHAQMGDRIRFSVRVNDHYVLDHVTLTNHVTGEVSVMEPYGYPYIGHRVFDYWFDMPKANVTLTAYFNEAHMVTSGLSPEAVGDDVLAYRVFYESDGDEYISSDTFFTPGEQVYIGFFNRGGYYFDHLTLTRDDNGEPVTYELLTQEEDNEYQTYYVIGFIMPDADVSFMAYYNRFSPLRQIEDPRSGVGNEDGEEVIVDDELIVVWGAKDYLWAKDQARSNYFVDFEGIDARDYVTTDMKLQKHEWDQSNWVILDGTALYPGLSTEERRQKLNEFVDHKIVPSTIRGIFHCNRGDLTTTGYTIELSNDYIPQAVPHATSDVSSSLGYPGYLQDPREENTDYDYRYNHFVPANFIGNYDECDPENHIFPMGENHIPSVTEDLNFFIPPKDKEVAQVWAVYDGHSEDKQENYDYFTTYEPYQGNGISQNVFDLPGYFSVGEDDWCYNRLRPDYSDNAFGRPANIENYDYPLYTGEAYLFHIAIERYETYLPEMTLTAAGPNTPKVPDINDIYRILPLDMDSYETTTTGVRTIMSSEASEIVGISYFNTLGQESSEPFDGVNIRVIRYKDGSIRSMKIMK